VPVPFIRKVWGTMAAAHWHVFQVPRKRPERMREIASEHRLPVLANVWLGVSVESAAYKDRIEVLRRTPARVRFVSFEPLLAPVGRVKLEGIHWAPDRCSRLMTNE
jgi:protein gp37